MHPDLGNVKYHVVSWLCDIKSQSGDIKYFVKYIHALITWKINLH